MDTLWRNDKIQFSRLLSEIRAAGLSNNQRKFLRISMDLTAGEIDAIFDRADAVFQKAIDKAYRESTKGAR